MKNKRWKRLAKRINGECFKGHYPCNKCKYVHECFTRLSLGGRNLGIRRIERELKAYNIKYSKRR